MLRFSGCLRARKDIVEELLGRGRLVDLQMFAYFNSELSREVNSAATPQEPAAAAPATAEEKIVAAARSEKQRVHENFVARCARVQELARTQGPQAWLGEAYGREEWTTPHSVYGSLKAAIQQNSSSSSSAAPKVVLHGQATAAGGPCDASSPAALPARVQVAVMQPNAASAASDSAPLPRFVSVSVPLNQPDGKVRGEMVNGLLRLVFNGAVGDVVLENVAVKNAKGAPLPLVFRRPEQVAARQHVLTAAAYAGLLAKVEEITALHATNTVQYDGLRLRDTAVQMRLAHISCSRYAVETLMRYVAGDAMLDDADAAEIKKKVLLEAFDPARAASASTASRGGSSNSSSSSSAAADPAAEQPLDYVDVVRNEGAGLYELPLLDSIALNIFAENALIDSLDSAWMIVRDHPLTDSVPHGSNPKKRIDYPFLRSLFDAPKYSLASADGSMELQTLSYLAPLLGSRERPGVRGGAGSPFELGGVDILEAAQNMLGMTPTGSMRLSAPHTDVLLFAKSIERDLNSLVRTIEQSSTTTAPLGKPTSPLKKAGAEPALAFFVANYAAELLASIAVLNRCSAALTADADGRGRREWLQLQCFTAASSARRKKHYTDFLMMRAAAQVVGTEERYSTHPVELMNAVSRKKGADAGATATAAASGSSRSSSSRKASN